MDSLIRIFQALPTDVQLSLPISGVSSLCYALVAIIAILFERLVRITYTDTIFICMYAKQSQLTTAVPKGNSEMLVYLYVKLHHFNKLKHET